MSITALRSFIGILPDSLTITAGTVLKICPLDKAFAVTDKPRSVTAENPGVYAKSCIEFEVAWGTSVFKR